jgi:hypothetical protein
MSDLATKRCWKCLQPRAVTEFHLQPSAVDGRSPWCRYCVSRYDEQYHQRNRDKHLARMRIYNAHIRALVFNHYGHVCACCGTDKKLQIDHINGGGAQHRLELFGDPRSGGDKFYCWLLNNGFPDGYQPLCRPCNTSKGEGTGCRLSH